MGFFDKLFGGGETTQKQTYDQNSVDYLRNYRGAAQDTYNNLSKAPTDSDLSAYFNPFQSNVIGGMQTDYDRQRAQAKLQADQALSGAGGAAFGNNRAGLIQSQLQRGINADEGQALGQFRYQGFNDALNQFRQQQQMQLAGLGGLNSGNQYHEWDQTTTKQPTNILGGLAGLAMGAASFIPGVGQVAGAAKGLGAMAGMGGSPAGPGPARSSIMGEPYNPQQGGSGFQGFSIPSQPGPGNWSDWRVNIPGNIF